MGGLKGAARFGGKLLGPLSLAYGAYDANQNKDKESSWEAYKNAALMGGAGGAILGGITGAGAGAIPGAIVGALWSMGATAAGRNWPGLTTSAEAATPINPTIPKEIKVNPTIPNEANNSFSPLLTSPFANQGNNISPIRNEESTVKPFSPNQASTSTNDIVSVINEPTVKLMMILSENWQKNY